MRATAASAGYGPERVSAERVQSRPPATAGVEVTERRPAVTGPRGGVQQGRALTAVKAPFGPGEAIEPGEADDDLLVIAARIVEAKITTKAPELVAELLADRVAGMRPTAIAKKNDVHHSVVRKVLEFADSELRAS